MDVGQLLLNQMEDEISYVVWKLGAGLVAMLWERLFDEKTSSDVDVAALNEMTSHGIPTLSLSWQSLEFGIMTVAYSIFVCGKVGMMVVFASDEPWHILHVIVLSGGNHLNYLIENAFDIQAFARFALGNRRPNGVLTFPDELVDSVLLILLALVDCWGPFRQDSHGGGPFRQDSHGAQFSWMHHQAYGHVHLALHVCCAVVLHLQCSSHRHEPPRHLAGEHRHHGGR